MSFKRLPHGFLLLVSMVGCSQTGGLRTEPADGVKTVASVGDRPLPIRSGTGDSSVRAQDPEPIVAPSTRGRISGRVYDDRGKPVPDARVRLAVGGEAGGKAVTAKTDRSGAFTLRGLRPGSSYTLIAEYQAENGSMVTGRVETEAPEANVKIGLQRPASGTDDDRASIRPARPSVAPVSNVEEADESADPDVPSTRTNREDLEPPAPEAEALRNSNTRLSSAGEPGSRGSGWTQGHRSTATDGSKAGQPMTDRSSSASSASRSRVESRNAQGEDDEDNPLPPALEPDASGSGSVSDRGGPASGAPVVLARGSGSSTRQSRYSNATDSPLPVDSTDGPAPESLPREVLPGARNATPDAYAPLLMSDPDTAPPRKPARRIVRDSMETTSSGASPGLPPRPTLGTQAQEPTRPTWGELAFQKQPIPVDESLQKVSRTVEVRAPQVGAVEQKSPAAAPASKDHASSTTAPTGTGVSCQFDPIERKLQDFQLPDSRGRMVAFHDLDSDLILLDFWGTWCAPCRKSIPHLNEIQKTLGGKKMQVIGIACERTPAKDRTAKVVQAIKDLKIDYPVLITGMDGTCPLQEAFQIQFYPTMVLVDRQGRILWREQGATDVTLARMDRFILKNLSRSGTDSPQAQIARGKN